MDDLGIPLFDRAALSLFQMLDTVNEGPTGIGVAIQGTCSPLLYNAVLEGLYTWMMEDLSPECVYLAISERSPLASKVHTMVYSDVDPQRFEKENLKTWLLRAEFIFESHKVKECSDKLKIVVSVLPLHILRYIPPVDLTSSYEN
ncbi:unnamed protein product [Lepeophtheirus salmonis]|uniref:(salmon louse) hypothetical protein n=1 Tax=Lepeophtheirus salmonis TaxID=72036 RepID=A0A7R8CS16_LEPSM|nr:unnamed protein product [Lepeophtheirus salmonis]CAF2860841.1 unnamed protein product [Lepeophtheirus salmonis]